MKRIEVKGFHYNERLQIIKPENFVVRVSNDSIGKTLSIENGTIQFIIPFEPVEKAMGMKED